MVLDSREWLIFFPKFFQDLIALHKLLVFSIISNQVFFNSFLKSRRINLSVRSIEHH